ncbi:MAG: hypothetical protein H6Q69_3572, partial [Firmicutes bacterium]|nr:hypothetical protein [Bacillota bacterium]
PYKQPSKIILLSRINHETPLKFILLYTHLLFTKGVGLQPAFNAQHARWAD